MRGLPFIRGWPGGRARRAPGSPVGFLQDGPFVGRLGVATAFLHAATHGAGALGRLLDDERRFAFGARRLDRLVPQRVLAVGIAVAAVEDLPAARDLLHELAFAAAAHVP